MVIRLDGQHTDITCAKSVIEHVRGRVIATSIATFVHGTAKMLCPLPSAVIGLVGVLFHQALPESTIGFCIHLNIQKMVWHNISVQRIVDVVQQSMQDMFVTVGWHENAPCLFATTKVMINVSQILDGTCWSHALPSLNDLMREPWPSIADVFCASALCVFFVTRSASLESSCVHGMMRLPVPTKQMLTDLLAWGKQCIPELQTLPEDDRVSTSTVHDEGEPAHERRRKRRNQGRGNGNGKRRRGVRKWVVAGVSSGPVFDPNNGSPIALHRFLEWFFNALQPGCDALCAQRSVDNRFACFTAAAKFQTRNRGGTGFAAPCMS